MSPSMISVVSLQWANHCPLHNADMKTRGTEPTDQHSPTRKQVPGATSQLFCKHICSWLLVMLMGAPSTVLSKAIAKRLCLTQTHVHTHTSMKCTIHKGFHCEKVSLSATVQGQAGCSKSFHSVTLAPVRVLPLSPPMFLSCSPHHGMCGPLGWEPVPQEVTVLSL